MPPAPMSGHRFPLRSASQPRCILKQSALPWNLEALRHQIPLGFKIPHDRLPEFDHHNSRHAFVPPFTPPDQVLIL